MPDKPNILLIAIDSIRADHMSSYGYDRLTTPHIDRFAQSGTLFENTFSPHIPTTPAYASMLTGLGLLRHASGGAAPSGTLARGSANRGRDIP